MTETLSILKNWRENFNKFQQKANKLRQENFNNKIFKRALIEISSYCKNNCNYCGIRVSNLHAKRYRMSEKEIFNSCKKAYKQKLENIQEFDTFVLQAGEDTFFSAEKIARLVFEIKTKYPDMAITLSLGEHKKETYKLWKNAGADRYLLRHESASEAHYAFLHSECKSTRTLQRRKECLFNLKELNYMIGAGFIVGSPYQTFNCIEKDIEFLKELKPQMIGIGPYIHADNTPFAKEPDGSVNLTLFLLSYLRILFPKVWLPATTALETLHKNGKKEGIKHGANVLMINVSPTKAKKAYSIYNKKAKH